MTPDSLVDYVKWMELRHNRLRDAILDHRVNKTEHALPGSVDEFDRELWAALASAYEGDDE